MELKIESRTLKSKSDPKRLRREGKIPAVIYGKKADSETIAVLREDYDHALKSVQKGHLPTTVFQLKDEQGNQVDAIIKEVQYHPTTYDVLHLDFEKLVKDIPIKIKVPIVCLGVADCVGVKQGGVFRQTLRHMRVRCLPKDKPKEFQLNVKPLEIQGRLRLSDIDLPEGVRPIDKLDTVAVMIAKR